MALCKYCGTENNTHHSATCPVVIVQEERPVVEFPDVQRLICQVVISESEIKKYRVTLEHILEYWNRDENPAAMSDALWHILETAEQALKNKGGRPGRKRIE